MSDTALPWFKFHPKDWRFDSQLLLCSLAARGLWIEMLCVMHEAEPYGHLLISGKQPSDRQLAAFCRTSVLELSSLLHELEENGVFSRNSDGTIFSRRMVDDQQRHDEMSRRGTKGARARYRKSNGKTGSYGTSNGTSNGTGHNLESEIEEESEKNPSVVSPPASGEKTEIPFDWEPGQFGADSAAGKIVMGWTIERLEREAESFKAHHRRKHSRYSDWQDTWGTWVRNAKGFDERNERVTQVAKPQSYAEIVLQEAEQRAAREGTHKPTGARKKVAVAQ